LPSGYKTDIRADTCKVLMRHRDHGNTKGGKFTISIYNVYSLSVLAVVHKTNIDALVQL